MDEKLVAEWFRFADDDIDTALLLTHDLNNLCDLCAEHDHDFLQLQPQCRYLTPFAVQPKYPSELNITSADVEQAIKFALEVKGFGVIVKLRENIGSA